MIKKISASPGTLINHTFMNSLFAILSSLFTRSFSLLNRFFSLSCEKYTQKGTQAQSVSLHDVQIANNQQIPIRDENVSSQTHFKIVQSSLTLAILGI